MSIKLFDLYFIYSMLKMHQMPGKQIDLTLPPDQSGHSDLKVLVEPCRGRINSDPFYCVRSRCCSKVRWLTCSVQTLRIMLIISQNIILSTICSFDYVYINIPHRKYLNISTNEV